jgi:hypothetical protein
MKFRDINQLKKTEIKSIKILQQWKNKTEFKGMSPIQYRVSLLSKLITNLSKILRSQYIGINFFFIMGNAQIAFIVSSCAFAPKKSLRLSISTCMCQWFVLNPRLKGS